MPQIEAERTTGVDRAGADPVAAASPDATFVIDAGGEISWVNDACVAILGWPHDVLVGANVLDFVHPDDMALVATSLTSVQAKGVGTPTEVRTRNPAGEWRCLEVIGRDALDDPAVAGIVCTARDLTARRMWEVAGGDDRRLERLVQLLPAIVTLLDRDGVITSTNGALTRLLGIDPTALVGRPLSELAADDEEAARLQRALDASTPYVATTIEVRLRVAGSDATVPVRFEISNALDDPVIAGIAVTGQDITELHEARSRLEHLAGHDALTELPNRALLTRRLEDLLAARLPFAVLYVDLDRFKPINDDHGHGAGDEVLREVAQRLRAAIRPSDIVARVGGDEFVVLALGITGPEDAELVSGRIRAGIEQPIQLERGAVVAIGASVGAAVATPGVSAEELLHLADGAMYSAKARPGPAVGENRS